MPHVLHVPRVARRFASLGPALALAAAVLGAACHHAPQAPPRFDAVGESDRVLARIVKLQYPSATFDLNTPAYMLALAVQPGRGIVPIWTSELPWLAGPHEMPVAVASDVMEARASAQEAYDACLRRVMRPPATRRVRRAVQRDDKGRPVDGGPDYTEVEVGGVSAAEAARLCSAPTRAVSTRPPTDGYLLLLASTVPLSPDELRARLAKFTVKAESLRDSMTAIGQGIFVDRDAVWSGAYVHW